MTDTTWIHSVFIIMSMLYNLSFCMDPQCTFGGHTPIAMGMGNPFMRS